MIIRAAHNRIVVLVLVALAILMAMGVPAAVRDAGAQTTSTATTVATVVDTDDDAEVTDLPSTGRGQSPKASGSGLIAVDQMVTTVLVLLASAVFALGGIGVLWRYERR
jgi:hypothetical protein